MPPYVKADGAYPDFKTWVYLTEITESQLESFLPEGEKLINKEYYIINRKQDGHMDVAVYTHDYHHYIIFRRKRRENRMEQRAVS